MNISNTISTIRKKHGYSQDEVAKKLGISRQTYMKIENGDKAPDTDELDLLARLYGIPVEEFFYGMQDLEKFKQMYLYILSFFKKDGVPKTKLAKLLYLCDFRHFYEHLESMSGVLYKCKTYGPLSDAFLEMTDEFYDSGIIQINYLSQGAQMISSNLNHPDLSLLSDEEKKEIEEICILWHDINTQTIVNYTHNQKPWMACRENEIIPYSLILQEDPDNVYTPAS